MTINNHFMDTSMNTADLLGREFRSQDFSGEDLYAGLLERYRQTAAGYARIENAVAVLSDLHSGTSYIHYGGFAQMLDAPFPKAADTVQSIWEEEILKLLPAGDLEEKQMQELRFLHFVRQQPKKRRCDYCLASTLRMRARSGGYITALHRIFYIPAPSGNSFWLALCLYSPIRIDLPAKYLIINTVDGSTRDLGQQDDTGILSPREKQVLSLIGDGLMSKEIAARLSISINTVSRHRQEILAKLQAKNSVDACRIARTLNLIQ